MKKHMSLEAQGEKCARLQSVFSFSSLKRISLLLCFCLASIPWRVAGQCSFINLTGTTYWSSNASKSDFYLVKSGAVLFIDNGAVITFTQACAGIRVESGGYLSISNNARLTSDGSGTYIWEGIEVYPQLYSPSAYFNNCTIENARKGIFLKASVINNGAYGPCATISSVNFINNKTSVSCGGATDQGMPNQCTIGYNVTNCSFTINSSVPSVVSNPVRFIEMVTANAVAVTGTTFSDAVANVDVIGIDKQASGPLQISGCTFTGVDKGIYLQGSTEYDRILNNNFNIPVITLTPCCGYSWGNNYGIFTVGSNRYRAEGNSFTGASRLNANKIYGIVTDNSSTAGALMFKNTFSNTAVGFQSQNNNINYAVSCNTFTNYAYSGSNGPAWYTFNGSLRTQGNNNCANSNQRAGNEWTSTCTGSSVVDIKINSASYFHYYGHFRDQTLGDKTRPECSTTAWEPTYVVANYCASGTPGYDKTATACDVPFYTCTGCRLVGNDLGIEPQLLNALNYYRVIADSVNAESETIGSRNALELTEHYVGLAQLVSNEIAAQLIAQSVDTAILYLESSDLLEDKKALAELYLSAGRFKDCHKVVDNVINATGWTKIESVNETVRTEYATENSEFVEIMNLLLSIYESGRRVDKCTEEEVASLEQLSKSATLIGPKACAYLKAATGKECSYSILTDDEEEVKEKMAGNESSAIEISAYPNPANDKLNISVLLPENSENPELSVYDITGRIQEQILLKHSLNEIELNTSAYSEGVYLLQVKTTSSVKTLRFSVQK